MYFIALTLFASFLRWRKTLFQHRWLMAIFVVSVLGPVVANELGWATAEEGRQPWAVHPRFYQDSSGKLLYDKEGFALYHTEEGLRTRDAVSESVTGGQVLGSIIMFSSIYVLLGVLWVFVLNHKIHVGPQSVMMPEGHNTEGFIAAAAGRIDHEASMSEAKDVVQETGRAGDGETG